VWREIAVMLCETDFLQGRGRSLPSLRPLVFLVIACATYLLIIVIIGIVHGMLYFTDAIKTGTVRSGEYPFAIGVLRSCDNATPAGLAFEVGRTADGLAVWRMKVHGADVPGRWVIVDGRFVAVDDVLT
jgi:hypothetical protein